nr:MAG TPA: hypothetical protein [Caudoviricetes sp.]
MWTTASSFFVYIIFDCVLGYFGFLLAFVILSAVVLHSWHPEMGAFIML